MTTKALSYLIMVATLFACGSRGIKAKEPTYCLGLENLGLAPTEGLSKFDLHLNSGIVVSFPRIPLGWQITIDNESNGMPEISGFAIEQAADLVAPEFGADLLRVSAMPKELVNSGMPNKMTVTGYVESVKGRHKAGPAHLHQ